ncbi:hypothetical protein LOTGIDRAFT_229365 [Lottia gigantea]|uniref:Uncharacterized protein n=1 Tax=Lottia gigantea TaxID=225164 RepID=V3ZXA5_LOTGI|nr:hypothetical protein LOTGIDRAFT_229365 [Lottia gigantea]ESO87255.1 hypothetical protein LOTGIDRAFT_229365 [Lottia gigantea]
MMRESSPRNSNNYYYKLVLSDGQTSYPNFLLPMKYENFMIGTAGEYSVIRLKKYNKKPSVGPLPDVYLSDVALVQDGWSYRKKLGNPVPYRQDRPQIKMAEPKKDLEKVSESKTTSKEVEVSRTNNKVKGKPLEESKKDNIMADASKDASKADQKKAKKEKNTKDENNTKEVKNTIEVKNTKEETNTKQEKKEDIKTYANNNKSALLSQKIEDYVCDIVRTIQFGDMSDVEDIMEHLSSIRFNRNTSHRINYVKLIQCLGEIGIEELIHVIRQTTFICCETHRQKHLYPYLDLLYTIMNNVNVIKRVVYHRATLIPLFFKSLKLRESSETNIRVIQILSLFLTVGTRQITEIYYRKGLLSLLADIDHETPVFEILGILQTMVNYGDRNVRQAIKKSQILYELETWGGGYESEALEIKNIIRAGKWPCLSKEGAITAKKRLESRLEFDPVKQYCSSPKCRKDITGNTIKYCGAYWLLTTSKTHHPVLLCLHTAAMKYVWVSETISTKGSN